MPEGEEDEEDEGEGGAFYLIDLGTVVRKYVQVCDFLKFSK